MKRKTILKAHIGATIVAAITIITFFSLSLVAEIKGDISFIQRIKALILYALPILVVTMPVLKFTGDKLAAKSKSPMVLAKKKRMKLIGINGMVLISMAVFLYYRSHYQSIDQLFLIAQMMEFGFGLGNLTLIALSAKDGRQLSGRLLK